MKHLTDEQVRILVAIDEGRLTVNRHGRYEIEEEERPDRKSREQLRSRGLIVHWYERGRGSHWRLTPKGRIQMREELAARVAATRSDIARRQAEGASFPDAYMAALARSKDAS